MNVSLRSMAVSCCFLADISSCRMRSKLDAQVIFGVRDASSDLAEILDVDCCVRALKYERRTYRAG